MFGLWAAIRFDALLLVIAAQVLRMIRQLAPFVRYDGYHALADLTGVPDLFAHLKPTLKGLLPTHWGQAGGPRAQDLGPRGGERLGAHRRTAPARRARAHGAGPAPAGRHRLGWPSPAVGPAG